MWFFKDSIFSWRCIVFTMIFAVMLWSTSFSHETMFPKVEIISMQEHLPVIFLVIYSMKSICCYYYIKLDAQDKIIDLCILHVLVTWSLNGTDCGNAVRWSLGQLVYSFCDLFLALLVALCSCFYTKHMLPICAPGYCLVPATWQEKTDSWMQKMDDGLTFCPPRC